jgi:hypothetical protein
MTTNELGGPLEHRQLAIPSNNDDGRRRRHLHCSTRPPPPPSKNSSFYPAGCASPSLQMFFGEWQVQGLEVGRLRVSTAVCAYALIGV